MALPSNQSLGEVEAMKQQLLEGPRNFPRTKHNLGLLTTIISYGGPAAQNAIISLARMYQPSNYRSSGTKKSRLGGRNQRRVKRKTRSRNQRRVKRKTRSRR